MFGKKNDPTNFNPEEFQFIICYDKFTKPMALSLRNRIGKDVKCVIWSRKVYDDNESKLSNKNFLVLFNEDMIEKNLSNPSLKPSTFSKGVLVKCEGNTLGIYIDPEAEYSSFKDLFKQSWRKYTMGVVAPILLVGGIPLATFLTWIFLEKTKTELNSDFCLMRLIK